MSVKVKVPTPLRRLTNNQREVQVNASNVREVIEGLEESFPGIRERLCDESGEIRQFINFLSTVRIYVSATDLPPKLRMAKQYQLCRLRLGDKLIPSPCYSSVVGRTNPKLVIHTEWVSLFPTIGPFRPIIMTTRILMGQATAHA